MRVGIYLDVRNPAQWQRPWPEVYGFALEMCEEAERLGADSVWLSEHHLFDDGYLPQPLTMAAAVAARTSRVRIGTAVLIAPIRDAVHIAEEAAVVDAISGGRLELGIGAGYRAPEYELFGADFDRRYGATEDVARELRRIWAEGRVTPPPTQERIPIWMGFGGPQGARRAGRLGEGLLSTDPALLPPYLEGLREAGHDESVARMGGTLPVYTTDDPERDWEIVARHHAYQWDSYRHYTVEGTARAAAGQWPRPIDPERSRERGLEGGGSLLYGTPEQNAAAIRERVAGLPVEMIYFWIPLPGIPQEMAMRHLQTIFTSLKPLLG